MELLQLLDLTIRAAVPLLLACLAGLYSERAGIFDIGLEGKMLAAAFFAASTAAISNSLWGGVVAGIVASCCLALVHGFACISNKGNQIVSGIAINFIAAGGCVLLGNAWFGEGGRTPQLPSELRFGEIELPLTETFGTIYAGVYADVISGHNLIVYFAFAIVPISWFILYRTMFGLRLRAVGENPQAIDVAGVSVAAMRYKAVLLCGFLCGIAGVYLSMAVSAGFVRDMTAGRGFIALAALIFAKWRPVAAMYTCLLFGFLSAIEIRYQDFTVPIIELDIPLQLMQSLPYILVVVLLGGFVGKAMPPKAGGIAYEKEK